ncbi:S9 family peptidase [candidate division KSB1 bacterium]|nr:S9 family peptidase [candidate division KSB1 bacterium]
MQMTKFYRLLSGMFFIVVIITAPMWAQKKLLTFEQSYYRAEPKLTAPLPGIKKWIDDRHYLEEKSAEEGEGKQWLAVDAASGTEELFLDLDVHNENLPEGLNLTRAVEQTKDYSGFLFNHENDLYFYSTTTKVWKQLTTTSAEEKTPHFSPDGKKVAFTRENDLFVVDIETGAEGRLTQDGSKTVYNGYSSWVYYEEVFGRRSGYCAFWWSPNSEMLAFMRFDDSPVPEFPIYRADGVHGELEIQRYPKAGDPNPKVRLGIATLSDGRVVWVDTDQDADEYIAWPEWTVDSEQLFFQWMNRGQDHLKIYSADPQTGKKKQLYEEKNPAWVEFYEDLYFFKDGSGFLMRSSKDGYAHLYHYDLQGKLINRLTRGEWSVNTITLVDEENRTVYFHGSKDGSTENHLYSVNLKGEELRRLTQTPGWHFCRVSPKGSYFIDTYSNITAPQRMALFSGKGELVRTLGDSKLPEMDEYALGRVELFTIPSTDGFQLPAVWTLPPDFDPAQKYPVIIAIYGGPNSATVRNSQRRLSEYYLAQQGIILMSVDHRGSGHFGKKGVEWMHRNLGRWEMHDYIEAVKWLRGKSFIDSTRIGITGGSYGGFVTCLALTYGSDYFTHGIAEYSVTDYRLYDSIYTERYMDTPDENPEGYAFTAAAGHAKNLKGKFLIIHGTMDDNVHMQNSLQLIDELQNLNKDFEMMLYTNTRHGVRPPKALHAARERVQFWMRHYFGHEDLN